MSPRPLFSKLLNQVPYVGHAFFTREGGASQGIYKSLNMISSRTDNPDSVQENWHRAAHYLGLATENLIAPHLIHGGNALCVKMPFKMPKVETRPKVDALVTSTPQLAIGITSADCVPILLAAQNHPLVAAIHAGWKGAFSGIIDNTLEIFKQARIPFNEIIAALGPCIHKENYEVGQEVLDKCRDVSLQADQFFTEYNSYKKTFLFNLPGYVIFQLQQAGLEKIEQLPFNTYRNDKLFFSCRRSFHQGVLNFGGHLSAIYINKK
tara:strand:- start:116 stop:910 length:795 start_codon:yes stop_codon:yes gene_type:complete